MNRLAGRCGIGETHQIRWTTEAEARTLILQTTNAVGCRRDLAVLAAACSAWRERR